MATASGSMSHCTAVAGRFRSMRARSARGRSSTTRRRTTRASCGVPASNCAPSARASCISFSDSCVRRFKVSSIASARRMVSGSRVCLRSSCTCAIAPANGVRSSWAALDAKLRSASNAAFRRPKSLFTVLAIGSSSVGRVSRLKGARSLASRLASLSRNCPKGRSPSPKL